MPRKRKQTKVEPKESWFEFGWILCAGILATESTHNLTGLPLVLALFFGSTFFLYIAFRLTSLPVWVAGQFLWVGAAAYYFNLLGFFPFEFSRGIIDILNAIVDHWIVAYYYWAGHAPKGLNLDYVIFGAAFSLCTAFLFSFEELFLEKIIKQTKACQCIYGIKVFFVLSIGVGAMSYLGFLYRAPAYLVALGLLALGVAVRRKGFVLTGVGFSFLFLGTGAFYREMFLLSVFSQWRFPGFLWIGVSLVGICFVIAFGLNVFYSKLKSMQLIALVFHVLWVFVGVFLAYRLTQPAYTFASTGMLAALLLVVSQDSRFKDLFYLSPLPCVAYLLSSFSSVM